MIKTTGNRCKFKDLEGDLGRMHKSLLEEIHAVIVKARVTNVEKAQGKIAAYYSVLKKT